MSVQSEIDRLNAIKQRIRTNLVAQGITVPEDTMLEEMAELILSVAGENGKDYVLTEADKAEIASLVIEMLGGNPIFGIVDENNNIVVSGDLPDGTYSVKYELADGSTVNIGNLVLDRNVYYTVTNNLTNCTSNNSATQAVQGGSYSATITATSGYELKSVTVTMGGTNVSSTAVSGGNISIANVTGNIVITAAATEIVVTPSYTNLAKTFASGRFNSSGSIVTTASGGATLPDNVVVCNEFIPFDNGTVVRIRGFGALTDYNSVLYTSTSNVTNVAKANAFGASYAEYSYDSTSGVVTLTATNSSIKYLRVGGTLTGTTTDVVITANEEIA